jgi:hypothetical protein
MKLSNKADIVERSTTTNDANGYEIDLRTRGLRLCEQCGLVMSEGFTIELEGGYLCSEKCLAASPNWTAEPDKHSTALGLPVMESESGWKYVQITNDLIGRWLYDPEDRGNRVMFTDWEGDTSSEEAVERLMLAPYDLTHEGVHEVGGHDEDSEVECNYCRQLFASSHNEAVAEAMASDDLEVL